jgi:hypothetical protein
LLFPHNYYKHYFVYIIILQLSKGKYKVTMFINIGE